jgi:hypothetical protein
MREKVNSAVSWTSARSCVASQQDLRAQPPDPVEFEPRLHLPELAGQVRDHAARVLPRFEECALEHQDPASTVSLEVAGYQRIAEQERAHRAQHEIDRLFRRIDTAVETRPLTRDFDVGLINAVGVVRRSQVRTNSFL